MEMTSEPPGLTFDPVGPEGTNWHQYHHRPRPQPGSIILGNRGLKVPRGSWAYLDPLCDLVTRVLPGDSCYVTVFDRAVIPGTLTPKKFPCAFEKGQVKYVHFGSKVITRDTVRLQVRYDTQTDTLVIPLTLEVEATANGREVVTTNTPLIVSELDRISSAINGQSLVIPFSGSGFGSAGSSGSASRCKLTLLIGTGGFPRHGTLLNYVTNGQPTDCHAFVNMGVRYKLTPTSDSPYIDYIPMLAELLDQHGRATQQEYFLITVRIREGITNSPPRPSFLTMMMMEVDQFVMTAITSDVLAAEDAESASDDLIFNILTPLAPDQGDIISTDDQNQPIASFRQRDVKDLKIAYRPPAEDSGRPSERIVHVEMEVVDSDGGASERFSFMIVVKPMNTLAPVVTINTGQMLFKGQSRPLSSNHNLRISDEDNLSDVRITVLRGCKHGVLTVLGSPLGSPRQREFFTPAQLDSGLVVYEHDGSETFSDNILFRMTDGQLHVDFLFPVTIVAMDDEAPVINVNTGLILSRKETKMISSVVLSATDVDSEVSTVKFVLVAPFSTIGQVFLRQSHPPVDLTGWTFNTAERIYECVVTEWLQRDVTEGRVFYQHTGPQLTSTFTDQLAFRCQDDNVPPNQSGDNMFLVGIHPVDDLAPEPFPGSTLVLTVNEYQLTPIQKTCLQFTDLDSDDSDDLRYIIVIPPTNTDQNDPTPLGHIVLTDNPNVVVTEFTQAQVNHLKVAYKPPDLELGTTPRVVQFTFIVKDPVGHSVDGVFTINLQPVDNKPPVTKTGVDLDVNVKNTYVFTKDVLDATDQDTSADSITFIVTQVPKFGVLRCVGVDLSVWNYFTLADIHRGVVVYIHRGNGPGSDVVKVDVSDGYHKVPVTIRINVVTPAVVATPPTAPPTLRELHIIIEVNENGQIQITGDKVQVSGRMHVDDLTFLIEQPPRFGVVQVQGVPSDRLTLRDIIDGQVTYVHTSGEVGPGKHNDTFTLTVIGPWISGGNRVIQKVKVQVSILPVDSVPPIISVGDLLKVTEGEKKVVTVENIRVEDSDTDVDVVLCTILVQPTFGYLEITSASPGSEKSRAGIAVMAFHYREVRLGNVVYVQSIHKGTEPFEDRTTIQCSDGINQSEMSILTFVILPDNDEEPQVFTGEFVVMEGMSLAVDVPILNVVDLDVPGDVLEFEVVVPPKHGKIVQHLATGTVIVVTFTLDQIRTGSTIVYEHDGSETRHDNFSVKVTDGKHVVEKEVIVTVIPVDDETPRLAINTGLEVEFREWKVITNKILKATDLDSEDGTLMFIIRRDPEQGCLQRLVASRKVLLNMTVGMNFTQDDLDSGLIRYIHTGLGGVRDLVKFDVTDGVNPLIDRYFYVTVGGVDAVFPVVVVNRGVSLKEGGRALLTTDLLSTSDLNSPDEHLTFTLTRDPARGRLEVTDRPGVAITTFTQLQLAGSKVLYVHTAEDEARMDSFQFQITDGRNVVYRTFRVSITDVDNKKPVLTIHRLVLVAGETKLVTPFELSVKDRDTPDGQLIFTVTQQPLHGRLLYNGTRVATTFTKLDLIENLICYKHHGTSNTRNDSFLFTVTDGVHTGFYVYPETGHVTVQPQKLEIQVNVVDRTGPRVVVNKPVSTLKVLHTGQLGLLFTSKVLRVVNQEDRRGQGTKERGQPRNDITFWVSEAPRWGVIVNTALGNGSVSSFTQDDIDQRRICYILPAGVKSTSDVFYFTVQYNGGNRVTQQPFRVQWAWVSMDTRLYMVQESSQFLEVTLRRRGHLGETSFVTVSVHDITTERGQDYQASPPRQVQFNPGQTQAVWRLRIHDDQVYEGTESFRLVLSEPVMALIGQSNSVTVEILDPEDESVVFIPQLEFRVEEDVGEVLIPVRRTGDLSNELTVLCYTQEGSARGTVPSTVLSYSDYIARPEDQRSALRFDRGDAERACRVLVIDDSLYEGAETFAVTLGDAMGGLVRAEHNSTRVVILPHTPDEPVVYLGRSEYLVDESCGYLEVSVWRSGTDLSHNASVTLRSRPTQPVSALAGLDYVGIGQSVDFPPGITVVTVKVAILDDLGGPVMEGEESFQLVLSMPNNSSLGRPSLATITINDTMSDLPRVQFGEVELRVDEADGRAVAVVTRDGDLGLTSVVRCYTRQGSAQVMMDYEERPDTDASVVTFRPGKRDKHMDISLVDDLEFEEEEEFRLVLGIPSSQSDLGLSLGDQKEIVIRITDSRDKSVIRFSEPRYTVSEPVAHGEITVLRVAVRRHGDVSRVSVVRVHTKDGSAHSGQDYNPLSQELVFSEGQTEHLVEVEVLYDDEGEMRETFTLQLTPDQHMVADTQVTKATVFIEEKEGGDVGGITFPAVPLVVSLLVYDDPTLASTPTSPHPPTGYPLVCVTACDPRYPDYSRTLSLCVSEGINNTLTEYRWLLGSPGTPDGVASPPRELDAGTFLTSTRSMLLDAVYLQAGVRVQCSARAVSTPGRGGLGLTSPQVEVSMEEGLCPPHTPGAIGAEPFSAKIRYTGPDDPQHPNLIRLTVTMPHVDGMLPFISTRPLSNLALTLNHDPSRLGNHRCSNLQGGPGDASATRLGLTSAGVAVAGVVGGSHLRNSIAQDGALSLGFYNSLDLETCVWSFSGYYSISDLLSDCGGTVRTDGQVLNAVQSYVTLRVPLFVSYVFHSPSAPGGWLTFDLRSDLRMTFTYDTSILWRDGIGSPPNAPLQGSLHPTSMRINGEGRLVVTFRTEARFRGHFILSHPGVSGSSVVTSDAHSGLLFSLFLVRSESTLTHTLQAWSFVSQLAVRDYSGSYTVVLLPCLIPEGGHTDPPVCHPRPPLSFSLDVRFQQVSDPVPVEFSLNTVLVLLSKRELWLSDGSMGFGQDDDVAFSKDAVIYGRVMVDPVQSLGNSFQCHIQQVFLCTGADGYIPKYRPGNGEYGCLADASSLLYRLKILDKAEPESQEVEFGGIRFEARLAGDTPGAFPLVSQPDADGFSLSSAPLFQVAAGHEWYIHAVYTVRSRDHGNRNYNNHNHAVGKRSLFLQHHVISSRGRQKRAAPEKERGQDQDRGTNLRHVHLQRAPSLGQSWAEGPLMDWELQERGEGPVGSPERETLDGAKASVTLAVVVLVVGCLGGVVVYAVFVRSSADCLSSSCFSSSSRRALPQGGEEGKNRRGGGGGGERRGRGGDGRNRREGGGGERRGRGGDGRNRRGEGSDADSSEV
ncbi:FRAS1-related extracellular matrix protein 2-like [Oncorhynchus nerka]|uniref:FRAS1-related extracellular matrix protein 2-like n=1 Tax=Oncorhynchus nerka TaxID=8023 RepID=UPI0031B809A1